MRTSRATPHWARVALALALLNASLTLVNVWPTPFVRLSGDLSLEVLGVAALLVLLHRVVASRRVGVARVLAGIWVALTIGRYADVTAQSMWGRPINLYWDVPHLPAVGAMLAAVATSWVIVAVLAALVLVPTILYLPLRWAFGTVIDGAADPRVRRAVLALGALLALAAPTAAAAAEVDATGEERIRDPEPRKRHWIRAAEEVFVINGPIGTVWYWSNANFNQADWDLRWDWPSWRRKIVTFDALRFDSNDFGTNAFNHSLSGAAYYWTARSNGLSIAQSFLMANIGSITWEYVVEYKEYPSLNDVIFTPIVGIPFGEGLYQLGELFDRGSNAIPVRILAEVFGFPRKLHDRIDGSEAGRAPDTDALGLPRDTYHRFVLSSGIARASQAGRPDSSRAELGLDTEVVTLPHYGGPGHAGGFVTDRGFTRFSIDIALGDKRVERIGEGGFGIVYLAYDHSLHRQVAVKEYIPSSLANRTTQNAVAVLSDQHVEPFQAGLSSFINEARLLAQFDHPSLLKVYRFWEANGTAYMAMPFYEGITLRKTLKSLGGPPDEEWLKHLLRPLLDALGVMHAAQCFHRDIAPDNILILSNGRPVLLDFGAARRVIADMTQAPTVILKPGYAPVEQYGEEPTMRQGPWTDIYAPVSYTHLTLPTNREV